MALPAVSADPEPRPGPVQAEPARSDPANPPAEILSLPVRRERTGAKLAAAASETAAVVIPPIVTIGVLLIVWEVIAVTRPGGLPAPSTIWMESRDLILHPFFDHGGVDKGLFWHALTSLKRVAIGFSFAAVVGIALGVLVGSSKLAHRGLDPLFQVLRTVPPLAWLPISLAALHQANPSALFVIFITAIWPVIINTAVGVRNVPEDYRNVARVLRLSPIDYFFKILLPAATPYIFTGLRIGVGMSWLAIIASEMLLGGVGVGFFIWDQYNASRISDIVIALVWVGVVGFALDRFVGFIGRIVARGASAG
jgi:nitrate/nitrite transport system permease protein